MKTNAGNAKHEDEAAMLTKNGKKWMVLLARSVRKLRCFHCGNTDRYPWTLMSTYQCTAGFEYSDFWWHILNTNTPIVSYSTMATPENVTHSQQTNVQRLHFVLREFWCIHFLDFVSNYNPGLDFFEPKWWNLTPQSIFHCRWMKVWSCKISLPTTCCRSPPRLLFSMWKWHSQS